jgi:hypothetical protein
LATGLGAFVGCGDKGKADEKTIMNVSLNPEVEFVLDSNNKVVSVNALNEEGNLVISAEAFENVEGKSAEEAAQLFVKVSAETGFLVSGTASDGENEVEIVVANSLAGLVRDRFTSYMQVPRTGLLGPVSLEFGK